MGFSVKMISLLLASVVATSAASSDPGKAALEFLEKVRDRKIDLSPGADTALSPQTGENKKREIAKRIDRLAHDLGRDPLELGSIKTDDDLAAVLVRKSGGLDPSQLQVFPVALIRRGDAWKAAPLPASFENAGAAYALAVRKRIDSLEDWMLREQVLDLEKLRNLSQSRIRRKIEAALPPADFKKLDSHEAAERFLTLCSQRNQPAVLGMLGGISVDPPADWSLRMKSVVGAFTPQSSPTPWHLMLSPEVARVIVHHELDEDSQKGLFSIACLVPVTTLSAPNSKPSVEVFHFELSKSSDGFWRVDPSAIFLADPEASDEETSGDFDVDLADQFAAKWRDQHPPAIHSTPALARDALVASSGSPSLEPILSLCTLAETPPAATKSFLAAAQFWSTLRDPAAIRFPLPLSLHHTDEAAMSLVQLFSAKDPNKTDLVPLYFVHHGDGWLWNPTPDNTLRATFATALAEDTAHWSSRWQTSLLAESAELAQIPEGTSPSVEAATTTVQAWLEAIKKGDIPTALKLTARLQDPLSAATLLRNLGHEISSSRKNPPPPKPAGSFQGRFFTGIGLELTQGEKPSFPFYPIVQTPGGPKILLETDLFASRTRDFLNRNSLDRLQKIGLTAAADDLRSILTQFQSKVSPTPP